MLVSGAEPKAPYAFLRRDLKPKRKLRLFFRIKENLRSFLVSVMLCSDWGQ